MAHVYQLQQFLNLEFPLQWTQFLAYGFLGVFVWNLSDGIRRCQQGIFPYEYERKVRYILKYSNGTEMSISIQDN